MSVSFAKVDRKPKVAYWKYAVLYNLPLIPYFLSSYVLSSSDRLMIGYFCGEDKAGIYGIAYTMSAVVNIVWNSINATLVPTIYQRCDDGRRSTLSRLIVPIIAGYGGVCILIMLLSPEIIRFLAPSSYGEGMYIIPVIVGGVFYMSIFSIFSNIIYYYAMIKNSFKPEEEQVMENEVVSKNFIETEIDKDLAEGVYDTVHTRFPPEPNGYLHIGHAKSILLNYGLAKKYGGKFNLRFDDTNPTKEKTEFVEAIKADVKWLGAEWDDRLFFASNYFQQMYEAAVKLIKKGKAYVCDLSAEQIREYRGTLTEPGKNSPYRDRSVEENLQLFEDMKNGKFADGEKVLRAKIDMASSNMNMRDPVIYRVAHMTHHNTGDAWCIYPMYDFAHPIEDAIEGITHSICTLEFEDHRPLYDWVVRELEYPQPPRQIEFAKLYLTNVVTGKRYIKKLVEEGVVDGWDDPRLVSIAALRRRGFTPESIQKFVELCGVAKGQSSVDYAMLEYCIREDLKMKRIPYDGSP